MVINMQTFMSLVDDGLETNSVYIDKNKKLLDRILDTHEYIPRSVAEQQSNYKQIIPYAVLSYQDYFFCLTRLKAQTETRLHGKLSIGVGGHINPIEEEHPEPVLAGLYRELFEEVDIFTDYSLKYIGVIYEESSEVSCFHLGLLFVLNVDFPRVIVREHEKMTGDWVSLEKLRTALNIETWSSLIIQNWNNIQNTIEI